MINQGINILLAEDDLNLGVLLMDYLEEEGFNVKLCKDGDMAMKAFQNGKFDLCLLDVMMPQKDGFALAMEIKQTNPGLPLVFITAKSLKEDKLKGYQLGADDFITKPFDEEELLWKIKAIIRRTKENELVEKTDLVSIGAYSFDFGNQTLTLKGCVRRITEKECEILKYLSDNRNKVLKRDKMLTDLWGENDYFHGRSLDVFITKIRKYLKEDSAISIENVFRVGFVFNVR